MSECCQKDATELVELCVTLGKAMHKRADQYLASYGVTPSQLEILKVLIEEGQVPLNRLSESLCCAGSNITAIVDRLERDGIVERERSSEDRRVVNLKVTDTGKALWDSIPSGGCCGISFDGILTAEEKAELVRLLTKLAEGLS